jgi:hypothetical protein
MKLESVVRQDAGVERRCAGEVWLRRGVVAERGCVERGGGGVAARRVKGEEVGVDDTLVVVGAVYVAWERRARSVRRVRWTSEECASRGNDERGVCVG